MGLPLLNYPNVCTASPKYGRAFCDEHLEYLVKNHPNIPTDLRGFLGYCGIQCSEAEIGNRSFLTVTLILLITMDWFVYNLCIYLLCVLEKRQYVSFV